MKISFEVAARKTYFWPYFVARAKKIGTYRVKKVGGVELHVVEVATLEEALPIWQCVRSWKAVTITKDGAVTGQTTFNRAMMEYQTRSQRTRWMLEDVIKTAAARRDRENDDKRWRMGQGPEPR